MTNVYPLDYQSKNIQDTVAITDCYLCGIPLAANITPDHIIPDKVFRVNDPHRPKLNVHHKCNNLKSKDDEWVMRYLQIRSARNPEAEREVAKMIEEAMKEKRDAYIIGKNPRHYKLTRGIFDKVIWGLELEYKGQDFIQMKISEEAMTRFDKYIKTMCRGLFIRNIPLSNPQVPELLLKQNIDLEMKGKSDAYVESIKSFISSSTATNFGQIWGDRVMYIGSRVTETPNKGFIFVQFYSEFSILAVFK
jgi:hypothetical protein